MALEETVINLLGGGVLASIIAASLFFILLIIAAFYVYFSLAWMIVGQKLKYKRPWFAWVPFLRTAMVLQLGSFHWAWTFLYLIPILGWIAIFVLTIIAKWKIFEIRKYPGWLSLLILIPQVGGIAHMVIMGFVAWKNK